MRCRLRGRLRGRLWCSRSRSGSRGWGGRGRGSFVELAENLVDFHDVTFCSGDRRNHTRLRCRDLDCDLVRLQLDECVTTRNRFALFLHPARNSGFDDRLTQRRDLDGYHYSRSKMRIQPVFSASVPSGDEGFSI